MPETPPKSVHITNYYHKNSGGISTSYNALLAAAGRHRRPMRLIVPGEIEEIEEINDYAKIYYVPAGKAVAFDKRYRVLMPWQYMPPDSIVRKILLSEMPDIIEVTDKYTLSMIGAMIRTRFFRQINRPMLVHFSCERMDDNLGSFVAAGRISEWFAQSVMGYYNIPSFDFHIANSPYTADEFFLSLKNKSRSRIRRRLMNYCWRLFNAPRVPVDERIFVCPRGVDANQFYPARKSDSVRREMIGRADFPEDSVILLYAGRISPEKNVGLLPDLMELLAKRTDKDFRLLVAGAGPQSEWLKNRTKRRIPGKVKLVGHLDKETLANYYANADVFVHPNPKEPFGIAPLEAMASGVPTVVPNAGGLLFYATNENTWLKQPTAKDFADAVLEIFGNPELTEKKVAAALVTAAENTREKSTDFLIATYDALWKDFQNRKELFLSSKELDKFDYGALVKGSLKDAS